MSGGRPSSIKRIVSCAAASLHIYVPEFFYEAAMKGSNSFFGRIVWALLQAAPIGTMTAVIIFYIVSAGYILMHNEVSGLFLIALMLILNVVSVITATIVKLSECYHKYDEDIIGNNFVGVDKKCRLFSQSLELMFNHRANAALQGFKSLEIDYADQLTGSEKAVVSFYSARCYDMMNYYPNALMYYSRAKEQGFPDKVLPFLNARCTGANGDTDEAVKLYSEVLEDESSPFRIYVLTDIGRMYLKLDDPDTAMKWFSQAIEKRQNYAEALGGAAIAQTMLRNFSEGQRLYKEALLNHIKDPEGYSLYFKRIMNAVKTENDKEIIEKSGGDDESTGN